MKQWVDVIGDAILHVHVRVLICYRRSVCDSLERLSGFCVVVSKDFHSVCISHLFSVSLRRDESSTDPQLNIQWHCSVALLSQA